MLRQMMVKANNVNTCFQKTDQGKQSKGKINGFIPRLSGISC